MLRALLMLLGLLALAPGAALAAGSDALVPAPLPEPASLDRLGTLLEAVRDEARNGTVRPELVANAGARYRDLAGPLEDLAPARASAAASQWARLEGAAGAGNASGVAGAADALLAETRAADVREAFSAWGRTRTHVAFGAPCREGDAMRIPVELREAPPGGVRAYRVEVRHDPARLAAADDTPSFLLGNVTGDGPLRELVFAMQGRGPSPLDLRVLEVSGAEGAPLPVVGQDAVVHTDRVRACGFALPGWAWGAGFLAACAAVLLGVRWYVRRRGR